MRYLKKGVGYEPLGTPWALARIRVSIAFGSHYRNQLCTCSRGSWHQGCSDDFGELAGHGCRHRLGLDGALLGFRWVRLRPFLCDFAE